MTYCICEGANECGNNRCGHFKPHLHRAVFCGNAPCAIKNSSVRCITVVEFDNEFIKEEEFTLWILRDIK